MIPTRDEIVAALEALDECVHPGSPRGISLVYAYVPVPDAADAIMELLERLDTTETE